MVRRYGDAVALSVGLFLFGVSLSGIPMSISVLPTVVAVSVRRRSRDGSSLNRQSLTVKVECKDGRSGGNRRTGRSGPSEESRPREFDFEPAGERVREKRYVSLINRKLGRGEEHTFSDNGEENDENPTAKDPPT